MILVCGEALIDLFVADAADGAGAALAAVARAGGSPFNVAVGLARLGARAGYCGGIGRDAFGAFLLARLAAEGVDTTLVTRRSAPTPLVVVAREADGQPAYTFHAQGCADRDVTMDDLAAALPDAVTALAFGSYTLSVEPVGSAFLMLAEREAGRRAISVDPNVRAALAGPPDAWRDRFARFAATATVIKLSREDLAAGFGADAAIEALAARWLAGATELVVLTDGAAGATAYRRTGRRHWPAAPVTVVDTVGAGDTFHAALLARLSAAGRLVPGAIAAMADATLDDALAFAARAAAITCGRAGADLPRLAELGG